MMVMVKMTVDDGDDEDACVRKCLVEHPARRS